MCSQAQRATVIQNFLNRPAHVSAAQFSRNVGLHWTTIYGWIREDKARQARSQPIRSDSYLSLERSQRHVKAEVAQLLSERDRLNSLILSKESELVKLSQALSILS